ncbi:DUF998 domain-containing protein [Antrihabitans sp. YC3-6]|uniref:DUF998 domain-containing protein n=1 Tax=Antrihabitans stalagmiti TaxID=2799499 RepID=A0A934NMP6_9NOCA|nr:DUF998 domain-containing protein [Antrihabitans stalagmiti]MBJ8338007.1 DUF998 domain-containing protein [Antrihabitans stalagmiti]
MTSTRTPTEFGAPAHTPIGVRRLLLCGIVAGPVFAIVAGAQILTRDGFDLGRHPISLLSNGMLGWLQILNFTLTGIALIAFAVGVRRAIGRERAGKWGPRLLFVFGSGFVVGGLFRADPEDGFPIGTPDGPPAEVSWHGIVHGIGPAVAFTAFYIVCFVFAKRFWAEGSRVFAVVSGVVGAGLLALLANPSTDGIGVRMAIGVGVAFAWTSALGVRLLRSTPVTAP